MRFDKIGADLLCWPFESGSVCLFDGPGIWKINNLSCAHYESEELDSVYQSVLG